MYIAKKERKRKWEKKPKTTSEYPFLMGFTPWQIKYVYIPEFPRGSHVIDVINNISKFHKICKFRFINVYLTPPMYY
jgi:hypothetical protein